MGITGLARRLCLALPVALAAAQAGAQDEQVYYEHERYGAWEMTLHFNRVGSAVYTDVADDLQLDADNGSGWGATIGYNLNNQLLLGLEFTAAQQDYRARDSSGVADREFELDMTSTHFFGTWHFRPEGLTPFVTVSAGWTNVDSNIVSSAPVGDCWWDAWYGYICSGYYPTHNESFLSARAAAGVRWDFHTNLFARVSYGKHWIDPGDNDTPAPTMARFEIGFRR